MSFRVASANPMGGTIEIRENAVDGKLLGKVEVLCTGSWLNYKIVKCKIIHQLKQEVDLYLVFKGTGGEIMRLDWFSFD